MSAELEPYSSVYYCLACGACLREHYPDGSHVTYHREVPHGLVLTYDEESKPQ